MKKVVLALVLFVVVPEYAPSIASADPAAVESLIREGVELRKKGLDQRALPLFKRAYDLERSPRTATQLGFCEVQLGYWLAAERHLTEALSAISNPWLAKNEAVIRQTLKKVQASIGEVELAGSPIGAEVEVNGQVAGMLPLGKPVRVPAGMAQVTLRAAGHTEASATTLVEGGKRAQVLLALTPTAAPPAPAAVKAKPASVAMTLASAKPSGANPASPTLKNVAWVATVGAAAATGLGFYGLHTRNRYGRQFDDYRIPETNTQPCYTRAANKGGYDCPNIDKKMKFAEKLMIASFIGSGVLAAGGVLAFVLASRADEKQRNSGGGEVSLQLGDGSTRPLGMVWTQAF